MLRRSILLASVLALISTACGGEDRAQTLEAEPTEVPAEQVVTDEATLRQALLTIEDLPTGWTTAAEEEGATEEEPAPCGIEPTEEETTSVEEHFQKGELEDQLMVSVSAFDNAGDAEAALQEFRTQLQNCREWEDTDDEGTHFAWALSPLSFPNLGEETVAFRVSADITGNEEGFEITASMVGDMIVVRRVNAVSGVFHFGLGLFGPAEIDSEQTETFARKADEKLSSAFG